MASVWYTVVIDCRDPQSLGRWWAAALDAPVAYDTPEEVAVEPYAESGPALVFVPVPEPKTAKNRLHIDLNPEDRNAEVERLIGLGATRAEVGQTGQESWVVLADPEGNEFCVLRARREDPHPHPAQPAQS